MEEVAFENGVETIGNCAFSGCAITSIDFPANIKSIGTAAFRDCSKLETAKSKHDIAVGSDAFAGTKVDKIEITGGEDKNTKPKVQVGWYRDNDGSGSP
ncbi:MAG TPA: hypothetical protein DG753_07185 [Clostridium sp.]|nr:hypothetical protein [Clostridium sp.]